MEWIVCKKELPEINTKCFLLYSNEKVSGGKYIGERVFDVDYQDKDKSVFVYAWMRQPQELNEVKNKLWSQTRGKI